MRTTHISSRRVAAALTRGFFNAYFSGQIDARFPERKDIQPTAYKQIAADNYEELSAVFLSVLFPILARLNFNDAETVAEDMRRRHFSDSTSPKILLRYACGSKPVYDTVVEEYRRQLAAMLGGHGQSVADFFAGCAPYDTDEAKVPVALAIRSMVRVQMHAYATGLTAGPAGARHFRQATIYRLMIGGMTALLHTEPFVPKTDNLEMIFRAAALNSDNFETLMNEMNLAHEEFSNG